MIYLVDEDGETVASYEYDPYGNILSATGEMAEINPCAIVVIITTPNWKCTTCRVDITNPKMASLIMQMHSVAFMDGLQLPQP